MPFVECAVKRRADNGGPELLEGEVVVYDQSDVTVVLDSTDMGVGKLYITSKRLMWLSDTELSKGIAFDYPSIVLHAVSRDRVSWSKPCIYCQLKAEVTPALLALSGVPTSSNGSVRTEIGEDEADGDAVEERVAEMMLIPRDEG
eukprot:GHVQ01004712.1.p1 GENE.GHVQ01004712.1~~GHVQ01004712.1.p1  ORF type:complete len:145 (+),score=20.29 GHVQ01004712.1:107-541(+)